MIEFINHKGVPVIPYGCLPPIITVLQHWNIHYNDQTLTFHWIAGIMILLISQWFRTKKSYILQKNIMNSAYKKLSDALVMCRLMLTWRSNIDRFGVLKNQLSIESLRFQSESLSFWPKSLSFGPKSLNCWPKLLRFRANPWDFDRNYMKFWP